jgi:hypothetical protein
VGSTTTVTVTDASWITVGQMIYVANAAGAALSGALQVTAIAGNTLTLLNPASPPAIPIASSSAAGLMNSLSGNVTDYVGGDNACHPLSLTPTNAFVTKSAAYTLTTSDSGKYIICSGGSWTLTLPVPVAGLIYRLRNDMGISGTVGTITLSPLSGTIDGLASIPLLPQQECTIVTDGVNWRTHGLKREVILGTLDITSAVASVTVLLPAGYRLFVLDLNALLCSVDGQNLAIVLSSDGGNTFYSTGYYAEALVNSNTTTVVGSSSGSVANGTIGGISNALGNSTQLKIYPGSSTQRASWHSQSEYFYIAGNFIQEYVIGGFLAPATNALMNAVKISTSSGTINNMFLTVKGVV